MDPQYVSFAPGQTFLSPNLIAQFPQPSDPALLGGSQFFLPAPALLNPGLSVGSPSGAARTIAPASSTPPPAKPTGASNTALVVGGVAVVGLIGTALYFAMK